MKRTLPVVILSIVAFATAAQSNRYVLDVHDFNDLRVDNSINVDYICHPDSAGYAIFDATPEQTGWLLFDSNGKGTLHVQTDVDYPYGSPLPTITMYSTALERVVNSGDSTVRVMQLPPVDNRFKAVLIGNGRLIAHDIAAPKISASIRSGNGQLIIDGSATEASLSIIGTGTIQADNLDAVTVKASVTGTGNIGCNPTQEITLQGVGSGTVYCRTTPPTVKNRSVGIKCQSL